MKGIMSLERSSLSFIANTSLLEEQGWPKTLPRPGSIFSPPGKQGDSWPLVDFVLLVSGTG